MMITQVKVADRFFRRRRRQ